MTFIQRVFMALMPASWGEDMRAESLSWMVKCSCGYERSIWEMGGIRWKAAGNPRRLMRCPQCGTTSWHILYQKSGA